MHALERTVYNYIHAKDLLEPGMRIVAGVSGGADSVCLLRILQALAKPLGIPENGIAVVHVNHGIRGTEAEADAAFTEALCRELHIPCYVYEEDVPAYASSQGISCEEAGRILRYRRFEEIRDRLRFDRIAVAHNQDDLAETVIFHMIRGSGLKGLSGISERRDSVIRPLLGVSRTEIEAYLAALGQDYCTDSTNRELVYARNQIRHTILPEMRKINPRAVEHICEVAEDAAKSCDYIHAQAAQADGIKQTVEDGAGVWQRISIDALQELPRVVQEDVAAGAIAQAAGKSRDITRRHIRAVLALCTEQTGTRVQLPYGLYARRSYDCLMIGRKMEPESGYEILIDGAGDYEIPQMGILSVTLQPAVSGEAIPKKNYTKYLDYDKIKGALCIRTPREGDFICIDGDGRTKKLSRVFIDAKTDREKRTHWPVLACGQEIIWVPGLRFSPVYYVGKDTKTVMRINYTSKGENHGTKD